MSKELYYESNVGTRDNPDYQLFAYNSNGSSTLLNDIGANGQLYYIASLGRESFFTVSDSGGTNSSLVMTDGTSAGTKVILQNYSINVPAIANGRLYLELGGSDNSSQIISVTPSGLIQNVTPVLPPQNGMGGEGLTQAFGYANSQLLYVYNFDLYAADGSGAVREVSPGTFSNSGGTSGGPAINTEDYQTAKTAFIFTTFTYTPTTGTTGLWRSDGTAFGTYQLEPDTQSGYTVLGTPLNGLALFFTTTTSANVTDSRGASHNAATVQATDGTRFGTTTLTNQIYDSAGGEIVVGNKMYFEAGNGTGTGVDLWVTDGTAFGTRDLGTYGQAYEDDDIGASGTLPKVNVGGTLYFFVPVQNGVQLWTSDGTGVGTHPVDGLAANIAGFVNAAAYGDKILVTTQAEDADRTNVDYSLSLLDPKTETMTPLSVTGNPGGYFYADMKAATAGEVVAVTNTAPAVRDLNADGMSDILFRRTSDGLAYLFTMNGATVTNGATLSTQVSNNWQIKGVGDFDGNGTSDLLFVYNDASNASDPLNGISYITLQNGPAATSGSNVVQQLGPEWSVQGTGDFDGDGKADVLYRRSTDGALYLDEMNGASIDFSKSGFLSQQISDPHWQVAGIGDFDGDGHTDILWRYDNPSNPSDGLNGVVYEWLMNGTNVVNQGLISSQPGSDNWKVAGTGDFDGDGKQDILFRYNNTANAGDLLNGFTYLDFMNGTNVSSSSAPTQWQIDNSWSIASIGDYNGDGKSDILFQHAGDGGTYIWDMNGAATTSGNFTSMQSGPGWAVQNGVLIG